MTRDEHAARAQRMLWGAVAVLQEIEDALALLSGSMPDSPEEMLEYRIPYDVAMEVDGAVRCSLDDDLRPMVARLKRAAVVTGEELERDWRETRSRG